jgi:predicted phosphodiesterase
LRVAVVSDIHGNLTAFEAVIADVEAHAPDAVLCGGDVALMGAQGAEVVDRLRELGWPTALGNTDELLWRPDERERQEARAPGLRPLLALLFEEYAPATTNQLGEDRLAWLRGLPVEVRVEGFLLVHAAPGDLWRAPMPDASDDDLAGTYGREGASEVAYGHIHRPFVRAVGEELTVANCGSVGLPWDGDPRAAYLLIDDGEAQVRRVEYDVERECAELVGSRYPDADRIAEMRRRGRFLPPGWPGGQA